MTSRVCDHPQGRGGGNLISMTHLAEEESLCPVLGKGEQKNRRQKTVKIYLKDLA